MKMIKFRDHLKEMVAAGTIGKYLVQAGINSKGLENPLTRQMLNAQLSKTTGHSFITPYIALGAISRVLAYANIILPQYVFLNKENGETVFDVNQFGRMDGIDLNGTTMFNTFKEPYYVYFSYDLNEEGYYDVFAAIVNSNELSNLMSVGDDSDDVNEESEETVTEEAVQIAELSKKTLGSYVKKAANDVSYHSFSAGGAKDKSASLSHDKKAFQRQSGIEKATDKLTNEESINELSSKKLASYMTKSRKQMYGPLATDMGKPGPEGDEAEKKYEKRASGLERAGEKFKKAYKQEYKNMKEERVDELSKKTLGSYLDKVTSAPHTQSGDFMPALKKRRAGLSLAARKKYPSKDFTLYGKAKVPATEK